MAATEPYTASVGDTSRLSDEIEKHREKTERFQPPKILYLDIEMAPNLAYVWDVWESKVNPSSLIKAKEMICFSAKWRGDPETLFYSTYHDGKDAMVRAIHALLDETDIIVHYYGKKFDIPNINTEMIKLGLQPPSPYKQLDLCNAVKKVFGFTYNKLGFVCEQLGIPTKKQSGGMETWKGCIANEAGAWLQMREYSIQDTIILESLHDKILPWIPSHPSHAAFTQLMVCPSCGSNKLQRRGYAYTNVSEYQRYRCNDCGSWSKSNKRTNGTNISQVPL